MDQLDVIKKWISEDKIEQAELALNNYMESTVVDGKKDEAYYLYGNICRKRNDWQGALNNYRRASDLNPQSPAVYAYRSILDILNYYNKDMYNQ